MSTKRNGLVARQRVGGFSLIELMIGLLIGLFTLLAVTQVYSAWGRQHRTVVSKNDSQTTVTLAAYALEQDLKQAAQGFGSASNPASLKAGCAVTGTATVGGGGTAISFALLGLQIVNGIGGAPDQIVSIYGNSDFRALPEPILTATATVKNVLNRTGINAGDIVILADSTGTTCSIVEVTSTDTATLQSDHAVAHLTGNYQSVAGTLKTAVFNQAAGTGTAFTDLFDLGPAPQINRWSIAVATPLNPVLQRASVIPVDGSFPPDREVAEGMVQLQAQYGYDLDGDGRISADEWFDSNAANAPSIPASSVLDWSRLLAIRYAIVARSRHYETAPYSSANPSWAGGPFTMTDLDSAIDTNPANDKNWRAYRYSVYEGVVPMRNVLWGRQP